MRTKKTVKKSVIGGRNSGRIEIEREVRKAPAMKLVETILQNAILRRTERMWNSATQEQREGILNAMRSMRRLPARDRMRAFVQMGVDQDTLRGDVDVQHVMKGWFGGYFSGRVADIFIEGCILAAERSLKGDVPVAMYWVGGAEKNVKVAIAQSKQQVTFLLVTPPVPAIKTRVQPHKKEQLWVVSSPGKNRIAIEQVMGTALEMAE